MKNLLAALVLSVVWGGFAVPANPSVVHIQRTMKAMAESTAEKPATVRILFYGQSIVGQHWSTLIMAQLTNRFPTVKFVYENRAIGGYTAPALIRTAESDLYPFYPDLLFFHVYGDLKKYEEIVRNVRQRTSAEIVLWSSHLNRAESQNPAAKLEQRDERTLFIENVAKKYGCLYVDLNRKWAEMMLGYGYTADDLLQDTVHLNKKKPGFAAYAAFIAGELVRLPKAEGTPEFSGTITTVAVNDPAVKRLPDGSLELSFTGNRVTAVADGTGLGEADILLDGRPAADCADMYVNTRPSAIVNWMPMIRCVERRPDAKPVAEKWTLTYIDGTERTGAKIHYRLEGSVTGFDGEGWNTKDFVSNSGRAVIAAGDFHVWQYSYVRDKPSYKDKRFAKVGDKVEWETVKLFADPYAAAAEKDARTVLVQNCANGPHTLVVKPRAGAKPGVAAFVVNRPAACCRK